MKVLNVAFALLPLIAGVPVASGDSDAGYHFVLGKLLAEQGSYQEALGNFSQAVALDPGEVFIHLDFARTLYRLGRLELAAKQTELARELEKTGYLAAEAATA